LGEATHDGVGNFKGSLVGSFGEGGKTLAGGGSLRERPSPRKMVFGSRGADVGNRAIGRLRP